MLKTKEYIQKNNQRFIEELKEFLRIPSISTQKSHLADIQKAANFVKERLLTAGIGEARIIETSGHPLVYGEKMISSDLPTVLVYGHYDVQPADPYELWETPPFDPIIKDGKIFARGASDDKGQVYMHIKALETMQALDNCPCNIKFLIEGEEEMGSPALAKFLENESAIELLKADAILVSDTTLIAMDQPSLTASLRGIVYLELTLAGPKKDLHSGVYGGAVGNPLNILCDILAALHDEERHITIPGFYDKVLNLSAEERAAINQVPFSLEEYQKSLGIEGVIGEKGYTTLERTGIRPALDVHGIWGGYMEEGSKTVLPAKAHAKLSMRLVGNQDVNEVTKALRNYLLSLTPIGMCLSIHVFPGGSNPIVVNEHSIPFQAAILAMEATWGKKPLATKEGGSIPILSTFKEKLACEMVLMGFGLDTDAIHSPNEHFSLEAFKKGIGTIVAFYQYLAKLYK